MQQEFPKKSIAKRRKIFLNRTERLMTDLVNAFSARAGIQLESSSKIALVKMLVTGVEKNLEANIDNILSEKSYDPNFKGPDVEQLAQAMGTSSYEPKTYNSASL